VKLKGQQMKSNLMKSLIGQIRFQHAIYTPVGANQINLKLKKTQKLKNW